MVKHKPLPPLADLKKYLYLDETSPSGLRWSTAPRKKVIPNSIAGKKNNNGYWVVGFNRDRYLAHRIAFYLQTGIDPREYTVDHVDGFDSPLNLRIATYAENSANTGKPKKGRKGTVSSRYKGVYWDKKASKWCAMICRNKRRMFLGNFENELDAARAYNEAAMQFSGEYARLNTIE